MLLSTIATAPSCQSSPCMKNSSAAKNDAGPGEAGHVPLLAARAVDEGADDRQHERAGDGGEAGQVERQRAGGEVQPEHADGLAAGLVAGRRSRRRCPATVIMYGAKSTVSTVV